MYKLRLLEMRIQKNDLISLSFLSCHVISNYLIINIKNQLDLNKLLDS